MEQLIEYLQALHRKELATGDHTTLLFNCFIKLGKTNELKEFIMVIIIFWLRIKLIFLKTKREKINFDVEIALKVVRGVNPQDALKLAKAHNRHQWVMRILLEDMQSYSDACSYLSDLEPNEVIIKLLLLLFDFKFF